MPESQSLIGERIRAGWADRQKVWIAALLAVVILLGAFLRFYNLGAAGVGNQYYAAVVKSMLQSWHNFFFVSFEPGGSVSVDKPPLGFWIQALSAYFLGLNGFALSLPNAITGVFSILLMYQLIRRPFGPWAGLAAALALALMPVAISAERNNTIDGLLVFVLLLAAWAMLKSIYTGKIRYLFLSVFIVGLGFNIKMLQAYLPLPAFYALYFFAARHRWWQKLIHLGAATLLLLSVSFSWAVVVDLTPPENRPYVGGSENNTVMELIFGHNGISRVIGAGINRVRNRQGQPPQNQYRPPISPNQPPIQDSQPTFPPSGQNLPTPIPGNNPGQYPPLPGQSIGQPTYEQSGTHPIMDVGTPGTLRLFTEPLVGEASWLLPFVLLGILLILVVLGLKRPLTEQHAALILWAGWLLPEAIYFTYSTGIMHAYYMIMMGAPIAALFAITGWAIWKVICKNPLLGWIVLFLFSSVTLVFQFYTLWGETPLTSWAVGAVAVLFGMGSLAFVLNIFRRFFKSSTLSLTLAALLITPALWSGLTTFNSNPNAGLPYSGPAQNEQNQRPNEIGVNQRLLDFLMTNTDPDAYLLATTSANQAAPFILATGRPVFTFGGFGGMDQIVDAEGLAAMVANSELRFVLSQGLEQRPEIMNWLRQNCAVVPALGLPQGNLPQPRPQAAGLGPSNIENQLFDCSY